MHIAAQPPREREPIVDDTQQLPDDFDQSEIYQEYLRRSKLRSEDLPRADREIRKLCSLGYHVKSALGIVQNKPDGYRIQPGAEVAHEPIAPPAPPRESDAR
jgi:hypothetical protein